MEFSSEQRENLAEKKEAMPDGSYPIRNVADLKRAIQAYGRAKDKEATKRWIKKRARELDATDLLPEAWREDMEHSSMKVEGYLAHHGVKGMKWGVRRYQNLDGSLTAAGKKRRSQEGWSEDAKTASQIKKKSVNEMSNAELRKLTERQNLERQYRQLNPSKVKKGMTYVAAAAGTMGTLASLYNNSANLIKIGKRVVKAIS